MRTPLWFVTVLVCITGLAGVTGCLKRPVAPALDPTPVGIQMSALWVEDTPTPSPAVIPLPPTPDSIILVVVAANTATPEQAVIAPTSTVTPTLTHTPTATHTPAPTGTPTPKPTATAYPVPSGTITRLDRTFQSASLQMEREVIIYLPPGYDATPQRRYPVLYLLHGYGGFTLKNTTEWESWGLEGVVQDAIVKGAARPMIVVQPLDFMPDGQCSLFFNHGPGTDEKAWGDYIWKDVVAYVDSNFRTITNRESRAIGGFSFGGQGALSLSLLHPEVFAVVGAHSPSLRGTDGSIPFINDWNYFNQYDPIWLVQNKDTWKQLTLWMDVAASDANVRDCGKGSDRCVEAFHALLTQRSIPHEWHDQWPGVHDGNYWMAHTPDYLAWYSSKLVGE